MKNRITYSALYLKRSRSKLLKCMKLTFLLMLAACLQISAKTYSQNEAKITLHLNDVKFKKAISFIEKKTRYRFLYSDDLLPSKNRITVEMADAPLSSILDDLLKGSGLHYKILSNNVIIIASRETDAADKKITGTITDEQGNPLAGVTVQVKETSTGTSTDTQGKFALEVPENATLTISDVGYETQEVDVTDKTTIQVVLEPSVSSLNELIVTGYTTQRKKNLTGAVSSVGGDELTTIPMGNAQKQL